MDELEAYSFKYRETLPVGLKEETNQYEYRKFAFSDEIVEEAKQTVFQVQGKISYFTENKAAGKKKNFYCSLIS